MGNDEMMMSYKFECYIVTNNDIKMDIFHFCF